VIPQSLDGPAPIRIPEISGSARKLGSRYRSRTARCTRPKRRRAADRGRIRRARPHLPRAALRRHGPGHHVARL